MTEVNKFLGITIVRETRQERQKRIDILCRASDKLASGLSDGLLDADRFIWDEWIRMSKRIDLLNNSVLLLSLKRWQVTFTLLKKPVQ